MGSIIRFERPRPVIRQPRAEVAAERESREARRSLFILIGSFFVTATVMCAAVVAIASSTWTDVFIMSAFVLVFALLKILLADALIYTMLRFDAATPDVPAAAAMRRSAILSTRQPAAMSNRRTGSLKTGNLRIASGKAQTTPS